MSSCLAMAVSRHAASATAGELARGLFLILSFFALFYFFCRQLRLHVSDNKNQYQRLFEENPNPMWVYDPFSLQILAVNQAAIQTYGYSKDEFLQLTLLQLRPTSEVVKLQENLKADSPLYSSSGTWLHSRKNGEAFHVNIFSHTTQFNDKPARLVLALDINDRLMAEQRILAQNEKLKEIAHLQSHDVRRPVASIMGLVNLFDKTNPENKMNGLVIEKLDIVCKELDQTIHKIVEKTYEMEVENQ
ncbi:MAG: PAS domain S-box protein [Bacteroidetes bacterium]|nr:PAS domain S-box protein [Bacteroidota bacterium]